MAQEVIDSPLIHYTSCSSSDNKLRLHSTVADWVILDDKYTEEYCSDGKKGFSPVLTECLRNALDKVDPNVDFSDFDTNGDGYIDAIAFVHSGYGAETIDNRFWIWSHKWVFHFTEEFGCWQDYEWTSSEGITVYDYHISPALWGSSGSEIGRIGVIAHETAHFLYVTLCAGSLHSYRPYATNFFFFKHTTQQWTS